MKGNAPEHVFLKKEQDKVENLFIILKFSKSGYHMDKPLNT